MALFRVPRRLYGPIWRCQMAIWPYMEVSDGHMALCRRLLDRALYGSIWPYMDPMMARWPYMDPMMARWPCTWPVLVGRASLGTLPVPPSVCGACTAVLVGQQVPVYN